MNRNQNLWRSMLAVFACVIVLSGSLSGAVFAQEVQPTQDPAQLADPTLPQNKTPEATQAAEIPVTAASTPEAAQPVSAPRAQRVDPSLTAGAPASLAHGVADYDGDDLVWQVQEIEVPVISKADSAVSASAVIVQRQGESIIRNDETGKRAVLTPGDAYFVSAGDSYTFMAEDTGSTAWKFSLVDPDDVEGNAFYESPTLTAVRAGSYDLRLSRYVLQPGETADLPVNSGAGLLMPGAGDVQVDHGDQLSILGMDGSHGQGQVLRQPTSISNTSSAPSLAFYMFLGESVSDDSSGPARSSGSTNLNTTSTTASPDTSAGSSSESESSDSSNGGVTSPSDQPGGGPYLAQINIYAETELFLSVTVDGVLWFDGTLPEGSWTGPMNGSVFEVYTSAGAYTLFENACGTQFHMGDEGGEVSYTLTADANSCPPPGN